MSDSAKSDDPRASGTADAGDEKAFAEMKQEVLQEIAGARRGASPAGNAAAITAGVLLCGAILINASGKGEGASDALPPDAAAIFAVNSNALPPAVWTGENLPPARDFPPLEEVPPPAPPPKLRVVSASIMEAFGGHPPELIERPASVDTQESVRNLLLLIGMQIGGGDYAEARETISLLSRYEPAQAAELGRILLQAEETARTQTKAVDDPKTVDELPTEPPPEEQSEVLAEPQAEPDKYSPLPATPEVAVKEPEAQAEVKPAATVAPAVQPEAQPELPTETAQHMEAEGQPETQPPILLGDAQPGNGVAIVTVEAERQIEAVTTAPAAPAAAPAPIIPTEPSPVIQPFVSPVQEGGWRALFRRAESPPGGQSSRFTTDPYFRER